MSSYAVNPDVIHIALAALVLVFGGTAEDLLPKVLGVGFPVLLASVPVLVARFGRLEGLAYAVAAGAMEEALSSVPPMSGVSFFLAVAVLVRHVGPGWVPALVSYPVYQIWLAVWLVGIGGGVFGRILVAIPVGAVTALAVGAAVNGLCRKAAIDEQG